MFKKHTVAPKAKPVAESDGIELTDKDLSQVAGGTTEDVTTNKSTASTKAADAAEALLRG